MIALKRSAFAPFAPVLDRLQLDSASLFGPDARIEPRRAFSTRFSRMMRVHVARAARHDDVFVKLFVPTTDAPEDAARQRRYFDAEWTRAMHANAALAATPDLRGPAVVAVFPDLSAIVTAEERGISLDRLFRRLVLRRTEAIVRRAETALTRVGRWLRVFQDGVPVRNPAFSKDYRAYLDIRLCRLVQLRRGSFTEAQRQAFLAVFDANAGRLASDDLRVVPIHADLCPSNIFVDDDGITVLDFAKSSDGNKFMDLAHLDLHVRQMARRWHLGAAVAHRLEAALLTGFDADMRPDIPLFALMLLQHLVCHLAMQADTRGALNLLEHRRLSKRVAWSLQTAQAA